MQLWPVDVKMMNLPLGHFPVPLLLKYLRDVYALHLMLLFGGIYRLLKESISLHDRERELFFIPEAVLCTGFYSLWYENCSVTHLLCLISCFNPLLSKFRISLETHGVLITWRIGSLFQYWESPWALYTLTKLVKEVLDFLFVKRNC